MIEMELQRFAEEGAPAGSAAGAEGQQGSGMADSQGADAGQGGGETFEELIKGKYKAEYQQHVKDAIGARFRNQKDLERQYAPIAQALGQKYGLDPKDIDGITKRLTDDDSLYADEANRLGLPVATVKQMKQLEAENQRIRAQQQEDQQEIALRAHFQRISQQAEELKSIFPDFDLMREIQTNPRFARMTGPDVGLSVKDAYYAIHGDEIRAQAAQAAAQQAGQRLAASIQAGANRPTEGGAKGAAPMQVGVDLAHLSKESRADILRRLHNGETVDLKTIY